MVTVEEAALDGGFGSAVVEAASDMHLNTANTRRMGIPDRYIEHGDRKELLADIGLDSHGIKLVCRDLARQVEQPTWQS